MSAAAARALSAATLCEAFQITAAERGSELALESHDGRVSLSWSAYAGQVAALAAGFAAAGLRPGDTLGLMLVNRPEFHVADCAATHIGATTFSFYNTASPEDLAYIVADARPRIVVTERQFVDRLLHAGVPRGALVVVDAAPSLRELCERGAPGFDFVASWTAVAPDTPLVLIYTSGTTGPPKAVELTHANLLGEARGLHEGLPLPPGGRLVSYFPMAHIAERNTSHYIPMTFGCTVTTCPDPREVMPVVGRVRPTGFFGAPRIWEKLKSGIEAVLEPATREALDVSLQRVRHQQNGTPADPALDARQAALDRELLQPIRARLGLDALDWAVTGSAPTARDVVEFFHAFGIPVADVWGLSETAGVATANPREAIRIGTVGRPLPGVELSLAADGEVLVRGEIVMRGYRNAPTATHNAIDDDGWLHTGDVGVLDDGYLRLIDRKKELIINAAGKNMSPANIEAHVKASSAIIGQCAAIGDGRRYNVALIALDPDGAAAFARANDIASAGLAGHPAVRAEVDAGIARANEHMARVEQIKRVHIVDDEWQAGSEELTPTMKLKRRAIEAKYAAEIEALYAGAGGAPASADPRPPTARAAT